MNIYCCPLAGLLFSEAIRNTRVDDVQYEIQCILVQGNILRKSVFSYLIIQRSLLREKNPYTDLKALELKLINNLQAKMSEFRKYRTGKI